MNYQNNKKLYYEMLRIRMVEEYIAQTYSEKNMRCPIHLSIGQEEQHLIVLRHILDFKFQHVEIINRPWNLR